MENNPDHYISKLAILAENTSYVKYYKGLISTYTNPINCEKTLMDTLKRNVTDKVKLAAAHDEDSKFGAYLSINTNLVKPKRGNLNFKESSSQDIAQVLIT